MCGASSADILMNALAAWEIPAITAAALAAIGIIVRATQRVVFAIRDFYAWMARMETSTQWVESQMRPNGGSTLVDHVTQLRVDVEMLLRHDAERDTKGLRYGPDTNDNEGDTP